MYVLSSVILVYVLSNIILVFISLISGNKHQVNPLLSTEAVHHSGIYIIIYNCEL